MQLLHQLRRRRIHERTNDRLCKRPVKREIGLGYARGGGEAALVGCVIAAERANVVERAFLASHHPVSQREIRVGGVGGLVLEHAFVEPRRQRIDQVDVAREFAVFFPRDA